MNMILHDNATALVEQGNTLANPLFTENGQLKTFDYVVANPPFSDKRWNRVARAGALQHGARAWGQTSDAIWARKLFPG